MRVVSSNCRRPGPPRASTRAASSLAYASRPGSGMQQFLQGLQQGIQCRIAERNCRLTARDAYVPSTIRRTEAAVKRGKSRDHRSGYREARAKLNTSRRRSRGIRRGSSSVELGNGRWIVDPWTPNSFTGSTGGYRSRFPEGARPCSAIRRNPGWGGGIRNQLPDPTTVFTRWQFPVLEVIEPQRPTRSHCLRHGRSPASRRRTISSPISPGDFHRAQASCLQASTPCFQTPHALVTVSFAVDAAKHLDDVCGEDSEGHGPIVLQRDRNPRDPPRDAAGRSRQPSRDGTEWPAQPQRR